ncbi:MAG: UDP-N-acetylglucosamine diphosphorylase/glucosamine-1-phosphate N-acetyltransferase [Candidatus Muproteobacteria bacterium RBG_16_64_11]|uniref:Bifunctional protein GlmU n=1 Tax=Candidatus Muproteobacteria bacterium RBG_16_64_11 TaxID=1817758 RepID=A0A1F6TF20_9PROT|nr:MAG: UDP-N-acetylglucosamine diphosphorylase/glucosamine-1-phosphate N-acetyltransferase [Candidatus Muproteobacteria bacterium RBG_16_64_11]
MYSTLPKVLHALAGRPLLAHVVDCARALDPARIRVVYGFGGRSVPEALADAPVEWVLQAEQHGTGHALRLAMTGIADDTLVLVLYGDVPLTRPASLRPLIAAAAGGALALITVELADPGGYGRIVRDRDGGIVRIVEHKDATPAERALTEINTGILAAPAGRLKKYLAALTNANAQGEYYLTDAVALAAADGVKIAGLPPADRWEIMGVNSKTQLAELERIHQRHQAQGLMDKGLTLLDPARFDLRGTLEFGVDVVIDVNVVIEGKVTLGDGVVIGPNNVLRDCEVGAGTQVQPNCVIEQAVIGRDCRIGPFARIRPEADIADGAHIGNFVEIKKSRIGAGSKVNHLAYVGDSVVGRDVNIGAGAITANYDGADKHRTQIEDNASIGSNCVLVAPVTIGAGATIGAGSVVSKDAPAGELTVARARPVTVKGWKRPAKKSDK